MEDLADIPSGDWLACASQESLQRTGSAKAGLIVDAQGTRFSACPNTRPSAGPHPAESRQHRLIRAFSQAARMLSTTSSWPHRNGPTIFQTLLARGAAEPACIRT